MLITSHSYSEYLAMLGLDEEDLADGVVDVSAGGSSFVAGCRERGLPALAVDPARQEVRIFPLVTAGAGDTIPYLDEIVTTLERQAAVRSRRQQVRYEFQRDGNTALVIERVPDVSYR